VFHTGAGISNSSGKSGLERVGTLCSIQEQGSVIAQVRAV